MTGWYDFQHDPLTCAACGWTGRGRDAAMREMFDGGAEYMCPACSRYFGFVGFPTPDEVRSDPRADPIDRMVVECRDERIAAFERTKLRSPDQLPAVDPPPVALVWDVVTDPERGDEVVILHGDRVLWREISWYENFRRFDEVARVLKARYGETLQDLVPSRRSWMDLLGDSMRADGEIATTRAAIAHGWKSPGSANEPAS